MTNSELRATAQKQAYVKQLHDDLEGSPFIAVINYEGISVEQVNSVRRKFETAGLRYFVAKNALVNKAISGTDKEDLTQYLTGMNGFLLSGEDGIAAAKTLREIVKEFKGDIFTLKGGYFDGLVMDAKGTEKVADLPSKEELLSMLLRTVQEGPRQILGVIQGPARDLVNLLRNHEHQLSDEG
jgi:large subunit ribosomal protein L10